MDGTLIWTKTPEREKDMYYSDTVVPGKRLVILYLKKNKFDWKTPADLKGLKVGSTIGYNPGEILKQAEKDGLVTIDTASKEFLNVKKLLAGRIDIWAATDSAAASLIKEQAGDRADEIAVHPKPLQELTYHLLLSRAVPANESRIEKFNAGLKALKDSGKWQQYIDEGNK